MKRTVRVLSLIIVAASASNLLAQAVPPPSPRPDEIVELSPFTVDATADKGYQAENTLAGSRLNTSLRDTPASVSVFTKEFLEDLNFNQIEQLIDYSVGSQVNTQDTNAAPNANNMLGGPNLTQRIDVRGILSMQGSDYFKSITQNDSYRVDRYDESRGPNGILFGVGSAGGIINQSSIIASLSKNSGKISYEVGEYGINRAVLQLNQIVVPRKLALALAAVDQHSSVWRKPSFADKDRGYATITFKPIDRLTFRVMGEQGQEYRSVIAPFGAFDGGMAWLDNRNALGVAAVTAAPNNAVPTAAQIARGITTRNGTSNATTKRYVYIDNSGTFFDSAGTYVTGSYNNPAVRAPDGVTFGASGSVVTPVLSINDPSFLPYNINSGGTGMFRDQHFANSTMTLDFRATPWLNFNISNNYQKVDLTNPVIKGTSPMISGEANTTLGYRGPANPYAGQLYIDAAWYNDIHTATYRETRASFSCDVDPRWKWLGTHRIAGMYARSADTDYYAQRRLGFAGAPFNADPTNANNLITHRAYLDEKTPSSFVAPDWRTMPKTVTTADGVTRDVTWINAQAGTANSYAEQTMDSMLLVTQSRFLKDLLITTLGYRTDKGDVTSFGSARDPVLVMDVVDKDPAKAVTNHVEGITRTQGLVLRPIKWLSLIANNSTNIGIPTFTNRVLPNGTISDASKGKGHDLGFSLDLLSNRLSLKAVAFTTSQKGQTKSGGILAQYQTRNGRIADALQTVLVGPGKPFSASNWAPIYQSLTIPVNADTFDEDSKGYEVSVVANLTRNWRLMANGSYTDRIRSNTSASDAIPWYGYTYDGIVLKQVVNPTTGAIDPTAFAPGGTVARWFELSKLNPAASLTTLQTSAIISVADEITNMIGEINDDILQNQQRWGLRPYKISLFTAYDFTEGRLKGFSSGLGYRWRSANIIGKDAAGKEIPGRVLTAVDLMLRYRHKVSAWRFKGTLTYQLNVSNLLSEDGLIPQRFSTISTSPTVKFVVPGGRGVGYSRFDYVDPRVVRFTTTFSF
jgi:iron complex outermembrane receptor protein